MGQGAGDIGLVPIFGTELGGQVRCVPGPTCCQETAFKIREQMPAPAERTIASRARYRLFSEMLYFGILPSAITGAGSFELCIQPPFYSEKSSRGF